MTGRADDTELRDSRALLHKAMSAETVGVLFFNLNGGIRDANPAFCRMTGYTREELIHSLHWEILTAPEFIEPTRRVAAELAERGETAPYEKEMVRKDGSRWWGIFAPSVLTGSGYAGECVEFIIDVTERKRAEKELTRLKTLLDTLLHRAPVGFAYFDRDLRYVMINQWLANLNGLPAEEHIGKHVRDVVPTIADAVEAVAKHVLETNKPVLNHEFIGETLREPGKAHYWNESWYPVHDASGQLVGFGAVVEEVTERRRAEEALRQQFELTQTITDNATTAILMMDDKSRCTFMNPAAERMLGFRFDEAKGGILHDLIHHHHPDGRPYPMSECPIDRALPEQFDVVDHEDIFIRKGGEFFPVLVNAKPIRRGGKAVGTVIEVRDVTDQKRAEAIVRENEAILRAVTNQARVGLVMVDEAHRYLFANQTYADIHGLPDSNIVGRRVLDVVPDIYPRIKERLDRALHGERLSYELHVPQHARTGDERFYDVSYEPRADARGRYVVVVIVDMTERKKRQEILERTVAERTARLAETVQQLETFSYSIVHDMRAPLRSIRSFGSLLQMEYADKLDENGRAYLERIVSSVARMDALITDVLNYSRLTQETTLSTVNLDHLVRDIVEQYPEFQEARGAIVLQRPLPPVCGNAALLTQIISNLIGNALKFMPPGRKPRVTVRGECKDETVRLWVEDNGIGIPSGMQDKIFGLFQRLHSQTEYPGTGVGLAIVKKAIERMGGKVGLESEPGQGSRFWVELPKAPAQ